MLKRIVIIVAVAAVVTLGFMAAGSAVESLQDSMNKSNASGLVKRGF